MVLETNLWREVSLHLDLAESTFRLLALIREHLAVQSLILRRLEPAELRLVTIASGALEGEEIPHEFTERRALLPRDAEELQTWLDQFQPIHSSNISARLASLIAPAGQSFFACPLRGDGTTSAFGVLLDEGLSPADSDFALLRQMQGPLGIAVSNDLRRQHYARVQEALEADRNALLTRLQRQDIAEVVIGESGGLKSVTERIEQVARTGVPVLILGETGSGKEVIARAIHARSQRKNGPVVRVNCGAIPSELIDSELFGHERGAFTGAVATRKGWFERADGGTLFLDEIGELLPAAQVRLLRVLQEGTLERVGGHQTISVDVRIVAATHRDLGTMVREGGFREDLWYRLSVFPLPLPPLRERGNDVFTLAQHFATNAGKRLGLGNVDLKLTPEDLQLLASYPWPGNVRELAAVIERAAILGSGKTLEVSAALGVSISTSPTAHQLSQTPSTSAENGSFLTLDEAAKAHMEAALSKARGQIEGRGGAAELLGINPHTLRARMRKLKIDWNLYREARH